MNHIENIEIKNFKSIRHQKIEGCKRINVFVGPPNVGKSNILEAMGLLCFINKPRPVGLKNIVRFENFSQIFHYSKFNDGAEVVLNDRYNLHVEYINEEYLKLFLTDTFNPKFGTSNPYALGIRVGRGLIDNPTIGDEKIDEFKRHVEGIEDFFVKTYKCIPNQKYNSAFSAKALAVPDGHNLYEVIINNEHLVLEISSLFEEFNITLLADQSTRNLRFNIGKSRDIFYTIPLEMMADTLVRLIFFKAAIYINSNSVLLFEEPEANLFEPYIMEMTNDVKYDPRGNQFFIVTHSQYVIDELLRDSESRNDTNIYLVGAEDGETKVKLLDRDKNEDVFLRGLNVFFNYQSLWEEN